MVSEETAASKGKKRLNCFPLPAEVPRFLAARQIGYCFASL